MIAKLWKAWPPEPADPASYSRHRPVDERADIDFRLDGPAGETRTVTEPGRTECVEDKARRAAGEGRALQGEDALHFRCEGVYAYLQVSQTFKAPANRGPLLAS